MMLPAGQISLVIAIAYLVGSIPFGYLIARARGADIFHAGSGNIGATNVGRVLGRKFGILVFALDFLKGAIPVAGAGWIVTQSEGVSREGLMVAAGLAAFVGHLFPAFLRFRGGKGVATGAGVVTVLVPGPALGAVLIWIGLVLATRTVSLASLGAAAGLLAFQIILSHGPWQSPDLAVTLFCVVAVALVCWRHRANVGRLLHGNENRLKESNTMSLLGKMIHVLALGLWFGSVVFFMIAALVIFQSFESLPASDLLRPAWLSAAELTKERATQLAGIAVGPLFDWYFPLQAICGFLAVTTALPWPKLEPERKVHRLRIVILIAALATVLAGWPIARHVGSLRLERYAADPNVVQAAQVAFGTWHGISLFVNFGTLIAVTAAMALAAMLPGKSASNISLTEKNSCESASGRLQ